MYNEVYPIYSGLYLMNSPCVVEEVEASDGEEGVAHLLDDDDIGMPTSKGTR